MNLLTKASRLFSRRDKLAEHSVVAGVEHAIFNDVRKRATKVQDALNNPPTLPNGDTLDAKVWHRLAEDVFTEYAGMDEPTVRSRDKLDQRFHVNRELTNKAARAESFAEQHAMTRGETLESTIATLGALDSYRKSYGDELGEHGERQNEIAQHQNELDSLDEMLEKLRDLRAQTPDDDNRDIDGQIRDLAKDKRAAVDALQAVEQAQAASAGDLIDAARVATGKAAEAAEQAVECMSLLPGKQAGPGQHVSPDLVLALAERVHASHALRQMLDLLGRLEISMGTTRRQMRRGGQEEIVDVGVGNDLQAILPQERVLLLHPIGRLDFYRRFHERALTQYEYESEIELKRGPVIFAADGSDSMRGAANIAAKALTLAGCSIGNREGRNTAAIEFSGPGQLRTFFFEKGRPLDTTTALDFGEHFWAGGTDLNGVMREAKRLIDEEAPFHSADLVLVTDGGDTITDETIEIRDALRSLGVRIHGLMIGVTPTQYMIEVCDHVTPMWEFTKPSSTSDRIAIDLT